MKKAFLLLFSFFLLTNLSAQKIDLAAFKKIKPRSIGPAGMSGRVTAIDVDLSNPERIYVGTASGGVWLSENGGISWKPIFDDQAPASIGAIAINQKNPAEVWVGTGEGNPRNSHNYGEGIFKSIDYGKTWKCMGLEKTRQIHRVIIHEDNPDVVYVGAMGYAWGDTKERGFYKTTDGGQSWSKKLYINDKTGIADLVVDPTNPNKLIASTWEFGRKPWTFNSGGEGSGIHISYDGGETWKRKTAEDGLPKGILGRIGLAIAPSEPHIVYALTEAKKNVLLKSTDGGETWKQVADKNIGNRPFYYADIFVDPLNENRIFNLWTMVSKSEDGGKTFENILPFKPYSGVHPDHHAFWVHPTNPDYMIEGNDGGLNISRDRGNTWRFVSNIPLAQFYHINYDNEIPYNVYGGMQDNGSWRGPAYIWKRGGIVNHDWQELYFGDGFDVVPRPDNPRYVYAMSQGGNVGYVDTKTGQNRYIKPVHPEGKKLRFHWNAGIAQSPFADCEIYFGSQFLHKSTDCGQNWEIISPDLTTNDTLKQQQHLSGGLTIDDTQAENHTTILAIAPSPLDENVIWVGTDDGNLQITRDGGKTWTNTSSGLTDARANSWIPQIVASTRNPSEAYVIVNDYRRNDLRPMVYHTNNYGATYTRIADENKVQGHALSIAVDEEVPNLLWLGTEYGLYFTIDNGNNWNKWTNGFPQTPTRDLKIHPREKDLIIGTYGRAAYILDDIRPFQEIAKTKGRILMDSFALFAAPDAYQHFTRSVTGSRFVADGTFVGENRRDGAMLTVWIKPDKENKSISLKKNKKEKAKNNKDEVKTNKDDSKSKKVKVQIFNNQGDRIRTFNVKVDTGMQRIYWNMRKDGIQRLSRKEPKKDSDIPSGRKVNPGKYKVVITYGNHRDSTTVQIYDDPRVKRTDAERALSSQMYDNFEMKVKETTNAYDRIRKAKKTVNLVNTVISNLTEDEQKTIKELSTAISDSLKTLEHLFFAPENQKGYQRNDDVLTSKVWKTYTYISSAQGEQNTTTDIVVQQVSKSIDDTVKRVNAFFNKEWKNYKDTVNKIEIPLFKD